MSEEPGALDGLGVRPDIDYRALLLKYIRYIEGAEGINYIDDVDRRHEADADFTKAEWAELNRLAGVETP